MAWDLEKILEVEVDRQQSWLTEYEIRAIETQFKEVLAKHGVNYTGNVLFMYNLDRQGRIYPNRPLRFSSHSLYIPIQDLSDAIQIYFRTEDINKPPRIFCPKGVVCLIAVVGDCLTSSICTEPPINAGPMILFPYFF